MEHGRRAVTALECGHVISGVEQLLVIAELEHKGRLTKVEEDLTRRLEAAQRGLAQTLAELAAEERRADVRHAVLGALALPSTRALAPPLRCARGYVRSSADASGCCVGLSCVAWARVLSMHCALAAGRREGGRKGRERRKTGTKARGRWAAAGGYEAWQASYTPGR